MKKVLACIAATVLALIGVLTACGKEEEVKRKLRNLPVKVKYEVTQEEHEFTYTDDDFGEIKIFGELYLPADSESATVPDEKLPAVILCHGFGGHYTDFPNECKRLAQRGYVAYAFDFCGAQVGGKSTGRTALQYTPFTMERDAVEVFKHIQALPNVDSTQVFLWGGSQGGFVAGLAAADDAIKSDVAGLALYFPAFNIPDDWTGKPEVTSYPFGTGGQPIGADFIHSVQNFDPFAVIPNYKKDVCTVWGDKDNIVARKYVDNAVTAYGADRAKLTVIEGAGHGFLGSALTKAIDTVMEFLEKHTYKPL